MSDDEDFWKLIQEEALGVGTKEKLQKIKLKLMNPRPWPPAASRRRETEMLVSSDQDSGARQGTQQDHPGREQEVVEDGPEKERIKQGPHQPGLDPPKHRGDTAVRFHSVCTCARMRAYEVIERHGARCDGF